MTTSLVAEVASRAADRAEARRLLFPGAIDTDPRDNTQLTEELLQPLWTPSRRWWLPVIACSALTVIFLLCAGLTVTRGIGMWGNNIPVAWSWGITDFVWWIGIGHAGTFISAFLLLLNQRWRRSINRLAEAMTLFALVNAGLFPLLHLGRPWLAYWLLPYPATTGVWPNYLSSLPWDVVAISTYFTVSLIFWYLGLVPDLAAVRDLAPGLWRRRIYGVFALGWRGSAAAWQRYRGAYLLLAAIATPLVISVHSIVSLDFSITQLPGWHSTIFPPYFVVGAIHSGLAMVLLLILPVRRWFRLQGLITQRHLDLLAKLMLVTALLVGYSYACETFIAWYSGDPFERYIFLTARPHGPYATVFWAMTAANVLLPQLFWWRRWRTSNIALFTVGMLVFAGMWCERFVIIAGSLSNAFLPSMWEVFRPTLTDVGLLAGSIGLFGLFFLAFLRWVPAVAVHELKSLRLELQHDPDQS
jgi:Ni/Fe-hydrogenase subunit HybB-like protein